MYSGQDVVILNLIHLSDSDLYACFINSVVFYMSFTLDIIHTRS